MKMFDDIPTVLIYNFERVGEIFTAHLTFAVTLSGRSKRCGATKSISLELIEIASIVI